MRRAASPSRTWGGGNVQGDGIEKLRRSGAEVGVCLQAYLRRTPADLERLLPLAPAIRIVKGAYQEPPDIALQGRDEIRERFFELATRLIDARARGAWFTAGTHDTELLMIRRTEFDRLAARNPATAYKVFLRVAGKLAALLRDMDEKFVELIGDVYGRGKK